MTNQDHPDLRSFGRRRGRKISPRQDALQRDFLPRVIVDLQAPTPSRLDALFHAPVGIGQLKAQEAHAPVAGGQLKAREVWLEIGFGGGEHLVWQAEHNPDVSLIGCEPFEEGVVKVLTQVDERGLRNIRLHPDDARPLLRWLPPASIARAFILFPDPWPKRKHQKRRLINEVLLAELARVMKAGAELRIGTDIADYARTILMAFQQTGAFTWSARGPDDWRVRPADWPQTRYEAKALREGRRSVYLSFIRTTV